MRNKEKTDTLNHSDINCSVCANKGYIPNGNTMERCVCLEQRSKQYKTRQMFYGAKIPLRYQSVTLDSFPNKQANASLIQAITKYAETGIIDEKNSLFLYGKVGLGKTGLSIAILKKRLEKGVSSLFIETPQLLNRIRASYGPNKDEYGEDEILKLVGEIDFLVLDDLGVEKVSEWVREKLFQVINSRYNQLRATVITSNFDLDKISNNLDERIADRIIEMCGCCELEGKNIRESE